MPYDIYTTLEEAYQNHDKNLMTAVGRNWMALRLDNPFSQNTKEHELYFNAMRYYRKWTKKGIDARSSYKKMAETIEALMALKVPNPYALKEEPVEEPIEEIPQVEVLPEEPDVPEEPAISEESIQINDPPTHILGIIPDEKQRGLFKRRKE